MLLVQRRKQLLLRGAIVGWYSVGGDDDAKFATYLVSALRQAGLTLGTEGLQAYVRSDGRALDALVGSIVDALEESERETHLFLDDFHRSGDSRSLRLIDACLEHAPAGFHVAVGARVRPELRFGPLLAAGQLIEIAFSDLRFDEDEARQFLLAQGVDVPAARVAELLRSTDGWAVGLQLLAFSLREEREAADPTRSPPSFHGRSKAALYEYLETETIRHLAPGELRFLTQISICGRFNRDLCEWLTSEPASEAYLRRFRTRNLFLIPLDTPETEPWFRFHHLFSAFLLDLLQERDPDAIPVLHRRASEWFAARGLFDEAMPHALAIEDPVHAVKILEQMIAVSPSPRLPDVLKWCEALPREATRRNAAICIARAESEVSFRRFDAFERTMQDAAQLDDVPPEDVFRLRLLQAYALLAQDRTQEGLAEVEPLLPRLPMGNPWLDIFVADVGGYLLIGAHRFQQALELVRSCSKPTPAGGAEFLLGPYIASVEGFCHMVQGDVREARRSLSAVLEQVRSDERYPIEALCVAAAMLAEAHYHANELDGARELLARYFDMTSTTGLADNLIAAHRVRARIERLDGNPLAAARTLAQLDELGLRQRLDRVVAWSLYDRIVVALEDAEFLRAHELLARLDRLVSRHPSGSAPGITDEIPLAGLLAHAEIAWRTGTDATCVAQIRQAASAALAIGRRLPAVRLGFMAAAALLRDGRRGDALSAARPELAIARELGMVRVLIDLGPSIEPLAAALAKDTAVSAQDQAFLKTCTSGLLDEATPSSTRLTSATDLLSGREGEILGLLGTGLSVKGIAKSLCVSPYTVKWHLKNVYVKLGAVSREDALARARARGILA